MKLRSNITKTRRDDNKLGHFMEHPPKLSCLKQGGELSSEVKIPTTPCLISDCSWGRSIQYIYWNLVSSSSVLSKVSAAGWTKQLSRLHWSRSFAFILVWSLTPSWHYRPNFRCPTLQSQSYVKCLDDVSSLCSQRRETDPSPDSNSFCLMYLHIWMTQILP